MKSYTIVLFLFFGLQLYAQSKIDTDPLNGIRLNTNIEDYSESIYLLTGEESLYKKYDWLKVSLEKNIERGIREGLYRGDKLNYINKIAAVKTTVYFYNNKLFKVRWTFKNNEGALEEISEDIHNYLVEKYGPVNSETMFGMKVWKGEENYLHTFLESSEFQVEYRDQKIHQAVESLK